MAVNDPVGDFLTRIRNALQAQHDSVVIPSSKLKVELARVLTEQGYIESYGTEPARVGEALRVQLKYTDQRAPVISGLKRASRPGRRVYAHNGEIPKILGGMGTTIMSTSHGVMTGHDAKKEGVGGEVVAYVW
jgi:small subunit ribosomal protein S8